MVQVANVADVNPFAQSYAALDAVVGKLTDRKALSMTHADLEELVEREGREVLRQLLQDHVSLRSATEPRLEAVEGSDEVDRTHVRSRGRPLETVFGTVSIGRWVYSARNHDSLMPLDAQLNLPIELHSHGVRRRAAEEAAKMSFDEVVRSFSSNTGANIAKRQVEELVRRAAVDFDDFYLKAVVAMPVMPDDILVITVDGKGIVVRKEDLRPATRKAADRQESKKTKKRLGRGEKSNRKRMAEVAAVYDLEPYVRTPNDVVEDTPEAKERRAAAPRAKNKRVWASVEDDAADVINDAFEEALRRDPEAKRRWVVLLDGNEEQLRHVRKTARRHGVRVTIIIDIIHVLEYLWKAGTSLHQEGTAEREQWVTERLLAVLEGRASDVAAGMRRSATRRGLSKKKREAIDKCARYLLKYKNIAAYHTYLRKGFPIATGVIEGACRYLVKDRLEITGARWSIAGAEAVLKLRALRASGDFAEYWRFHLEQEHERVHASRYASRKLTASKPRLRLIRGGASS